MNEPMQPRRLRALLVMEAMKRERRPVLVAAPDVLFVEDVAQMLRCSVDQVRRIPRSDLPAYEGPGKHLLYLREDVIRYVRSRPRKGAADLAGQSTKGTKRRNASKNGAPVFDCTAVIRRLREVE